MFHSSSWNCLWSWCGFYGHLSYFFPWSPFGSPLKGNFLEVGHWFFLPSSLLQKLCSLLLVQFLLAHPPPPPPTSLKKEVGLVPHCSLHKLLCSPLLIWRNVVASPEKMSCVSLSAEQRDIAVEPRRKISLCSAPDHECDDTRLI